MNIIRHYQPALAWGTGFDRLLNRSFFNPAPASVPGETFHESGDAWIARLDLPGYAKENVALKVTGRTLEIAAETPAGAPFGGKLERRWTLGSDVDATGISAKLENGVLELTLPKKPEVVQQPVTIEIQ